VLVDAGGFTGAQAGTYEVRALFAAEMMKELEYDAVTLGGAEAKLGADVLRSIAADPDLPWVSANLHDDARGGRLVAPFRVIERDGIRVGVTGVTAQKRDALEEIGIRVVDPLPALQEILPELRAQSDVLVLLCDAGITEAKRISAGVQEHIDVVVVGGATEGRGVVTPETAGSLYVTAGNRGQALGVARFLLRESGEPRMAADEIVLSREVEGDPEAARMVEEFLRNLNATLGASRHVRAARRTSRDGHYYLGANSCAECHREEYERWLETPHSIAFDTLVLAESEALPECFSCHVTGHGNAAGYDPSVEDATNLINVQCEVCHGMGSRHARDGSYGKSLLMESCVTCHTPENSPDYDPELYWLMMKH